MDEAQLKEIASQLSRPEGEGGVEMGNNMNNLNSFITARTIEALAPASGEVVAEIGPGNGALSEGMLELLGENGKYYGIELSDTMADEARQRLAGKLCDVEILCSDCLGADIPRNSLDGLMAVNLLYFIDDLESMFDHVRGWMKPGGRVVFGIRSKQSLEKLPFTQFGFNIRTPDEIKQQMRDNGFDEVDSDYYDEGVMMLGGMELPVDSVIIRGIA